MKNALSHFLFPRESNNHRAKILHHHYLFGIILGVFIVQLFFVHLESSRPDVLGTSTDISATQLLQLSNQERANNNLPPLSLNSELSQAAENKAQDMYKSNYWSHYSPIGTTPWDFIKGSGYDYVYAGENLARGFTTSHDVINAWMASQSHRENQLSPNYKEVGYAVEDGTLLGEHTTLVVEEFGSRANNSAIEAGASANLTPIPTQVQTINSPSVTPAITSAPVRPVTSAENSSPTLIPQVLAASLHETSLISALLISKGVSAALLLFFISILLIDAFIIEREKIVRLVGTHLDHVLFFILILVFVLLFSNGAVL